MADRKANRKKEVNLDNDQMLEKGKEIMQERTCLMSPHLGYHQTRQSHIGR